MSLEANAPGPSEQGKRCSDLFPSTRLEALLHASSGGDEIAFGQMYDAVCAQVYGLVLHIVGDAASSQEVSRDAFVEAWRTAASFDEARCSAVGWVIAIAHRKAVDWVRLAAVQPVATEGWSGAPSGDWSSDGPTTASPTIEAARVRAALLALAHDDRTVVELAFLRGLSQSQLSSVLRMPVGAVRARVTDGLVRLRTALDA